MTFTIQFDTTGLTRQLDRMSEDVRQAVRPAAQAGSQVLYEAIKRKVPRSRKGHWFHGTSFKKTGTKYWFESGSLDRAIYQVFSENQSSPGKATYHLGWNQKEVPYAHMVEYGTKRAPPRSFLNTVRVMYPHALQVSHQAFTQHLKTFKK